MMEKFDSSKDYYGVLGIAEDASLEDIDRVYRNRARELHPDRGGSEEDMKLLNEAHDILGNETARRHYDEQRRPAQQTIPYGSSAAFDPEAASKAGNLQIKVSDPDYVGLMIGAAMCIGLGLPFLVLIEMQYVFFLWPLRLLTIGVLLIGVLMGHTALRMRRRRSSGGKPGRKRLIFEELGFWILAALLGVMTYLLLYAR
jgi:curved DNA-binding protein CbpA